MTPQEIKALLNVLERIAKALEGKHLEALKYAIEIIESYELDCRNLENYLDDNDPKGFCQGKIYKNAPEKIRKIAGIK